MPRRCGWRGLAGLEEADQTPPVSSAGHRPVSRQADFRPTETVSNLGVVWSGQVTGDQGNGMKWRVIVELTESDGTLRTREISASGRNTTEARPRRMG
jgi:hypothetical protein